MDFNFLFVRLKKNKIEVWIKEKNTNVYTPSHI